MDPKPQCHQVGVTLAGGPLTLHDLALVWVYRSRLFLVTLSLTLVTGLLVVFLMPPLYEAEVRLEIRREGRPVGYQLKTQSAEAFTNVRNLERKEELNTEVEFVRSRPIIEHVINAQELTLPKIDYIHDFRKYVRYAYQWVIETAEWIYDEAKYVTGLSKRPTPEEMRFLLHEKLVRNVADRLNVEAMPDSDVLKLTFRSSDPVLAQDVVNAISEQYLERRTAVRQANVQNFFSSQSDQMSEELRNREKQLEVLQQRFSAYSVDEQKKLLLNLLTASSTALKGSKTSLAKAEAKRRLLATQLKGEPEMMVTEQGWDRNPALDEIDRRLVELNLKRGNLLQNFQEGNVAIQGVDREIAEARSARKVMESSLQGKLVKSTNPIHQRVRGELLETETEIEALTVEIRSITGHISEHREELDALNRNELQLKDLERRVKNGEEAYQLYTRNREQARISEDLATARLTEMRIIDKASLPLTPVRPRKWLYLGISVGVAFLLAVLAVFLGEQNDRSVSRNQGVLAELGIPVLAHFPEMPRGRLSMVHGSGEG